ncbi:hypothetical protein A0J61_09905 [Choanephora cucurbitarum]|uniref:Uncharacterized protein n=1 Tax=Choanephora cucurbitarum TaxID=101091 RepID=A0A1C7MZ09_9FUNG|nr:hypothetical protein A0J61_09905 [Choanephora cucurbitarum]
MHKEDPSVTSVAVHLENEQPVCFDPEANAKEIQQILINTNSTLMTLFKYHATNQDKHDHLYQKFTFCYTWKRDERKRQARKKGFVDPTY